MGLLKMLGLVRLSEYDLMHELDATTAALKRSNDGIEALYGRINQKNARIADLLEQNDRLAAKVSELSEALERKGHPLSWPAITDPDEPSTVSTHAVEVDPRFAAAVYEHDLFVGKVCRG